MSMNVLVGEREYVSLEEKVQLDKYRKAKDDQPALTRDEVANLLHPTFASCLFDKLSLSGVTITKDALGVAISIVLRCRYTPGRVLLLAYAVKSLAEKINKKHLTVSDVANEFFESKPTEDNLRAAWDAQKVAEGNWFDTNEAWQFGTGENRGKDNDS